MLDALNKSELRKKTFGKLAIRINPNIVTFLSLVAAVVAGYFFWQGFLWLAGLMVLLNGFLDIMDGEIAKKHGTSKFGDFIDHTFDRLADVAILLGITFHPNIPNWLGFATIIAVLLVSYMGTQAQALTKKRLYTAIASRADRILILGFAGIIAAFYLDALYWAIWLLLVLSVLTFFQRFYLISRQLTKESS